jgi:hypothetical protein
MDEPLILFEPTLPGRMHVPESSRAILLLTAIMAASAATLEPPPGTIIIRSPKRVVGTGSEFSRQSRTNRCENCAGKRSPEANYCPRCGHRRKR